MAPSGIMDTFAPVFMDALLPSQPPRTRTRPIYWILSIAVAGVLLYYSLRGIEWTRVGEVILRARLPLVLACAVPVSYTHLTLPTSDLV